MTEKVLVATGGLGNEVTVALTLDGNVIIKRWRGRVGLRELDRFIENLQHERGWLAREVDRHE